MSYAVRFTESALEDLLRLYEFLLEVDSLAASRAREAIVKAIGFLEDFPFSCRKVDDHDPFLRELIISFGNAGYVALFEIESSTTVTVLALRHQREDDYQ